MARTHLMAFFQQLYRDFEESDASGKSVTAVQDDRRTDVSRRDFLKASGAITAAASFVKPIGLLAARQPRIVIIGGGIAGLHAALVLQDAGYSSTIYEASSRIGGRIHSDTTSWDHGQITEHCGELIDSTHKTILGLAKRFGIDVADLISAEPPQTTTTYYFFGQYYLRSEANDDFDPVYHAVKADLSAAGYPTLYNNFTSAALALDNLSMYHWIEDHVPGGHGSRLGQLLDVAFNVEFGS